jgi:small subunit ribosomal protein S5
MADQTEEKKLEERVLLIRRVTKKTTGGNYVTFSALVVVGDGKGSVGIGLGRSLEVPPAIQKAIAHAKRDMRPINLYKSTLPHPIQLKFKAAHILLKPAPDGTGLKIGSVARSLLELAGVKNASGKIIGSRNQIVNAYAVMKALRSLKPKIVREAKEVKEVATEEKK